LLASTRARGITGMRRVLSVSALELLHTWAL
jgi:hypothetical protein